MGPLNMDGIGHSDGPVDIVFCSNFADGWNDSVKPPHSISLDGSDLILKGPQHL